MIGGAYFFSSLDTHRYQIQRHARKAGARAFAPAYRLSPQYPFVSPSRIPRYPNLFLAMRSTRCTGIVPLPDRPTARGPYANLAYFHHLHGRFGRSRNGRLSTGHHSRNGSPDASWSELDQSMGRPYAQYAQYRRMGRRGLHTEYRVSLIALASRTS